jgi:riboflavin kinase/FMN adenylyltransferase
MPFHHRGLDHLKLDAAAITIGSFDGVHLGHQTIFERLTAYARGNAIPAVAISVFPPPYVVLRDIREPFCLTLPEERAFILQKMGLDYLVTIPFTRELSAMSPWQFIGWINQNLNIRYLLVGEDFALGKNRQGNPETLAEIGQAMGYRVEVVAFREDAKGRISSSRIRQALTNGSILEANELLGRPYRIPVQIQPGQAAGGQQQCIFTCDPLQLLPRPGLYRARLEDPSQVEISVYVRSENGNEPRLIGRLPSGYNENLNRLPTRLTFLSDTEETPAGFGDLDGNNAITLK